MIKVYYGNIRLVQNPKIFQKFLAEMHSKRRQKVLNCKNDKDKYASLLAGILIKYGCEQQGLPYCELLFKDNAHGKPLIANREDIFFNISHSGDYVVCVFSDKNIGIDIENKQRMLFNKKKASLDRVAKRCFSVQEYIFYENSTQKEDVFLKFWTRKESYSKADGRGMGIDFSKIDVLSEEMEKNFCSDWLMKEYYLSIYQENISFENIIFEKFKPAEASLAEDKLISHHL